LLLAGSYGLYVLVLALLRPQVAPALPASERTQQGWALLRRSLHAIVPPVLLILFSARQHLFWHRHPNRGRGSRRSRSLPAGSDEPAFQLGALASCCDRNCTHHRAGDHDFGLFDLFQRCFRRIGGNTLFKDLLTSLPGGYWGFIIVANLAIFLLGVFLEFIEISFIAMPLLAPAAQALGIDMVWFGVLMAINLQMAFISPPVGFSLFYLQSVAPREVTTADIHKSALPFMALQMAVLILVALFPQTVRWLIRSGWLSAREAIASLARLPRRAASALLVDKVGEGVFVGGVPAIDVAAEGRKILVRSL
jgi:hypothetical protein